MERLTRFLKSVDGVLSGIAIIYDGVGCMIPLICAVAAGFAWLAVHLIF